MKTHFSMVFFLILLGAACAHSQTKLDLKTPLEDKEKLKLAKAGLAAYLQQAEWASIVNLGEDYSVWIKNLKRGFKGNVLMFEVDLELKTQADISTGTLISARHIRDTVDLTETASLKTF